MRKASLKKLERALRLATPCEECGWPPQNPGDVEIVVYWEDGSDEPIPEDLPEENQYCPQCGYPTFLIVTWKDLLDLNEFDPHRSEKLRRLRDVNELEDYRESHEP